MNKNKVGLVVGCFIGAVHFIWALAIWTLPAQMQSFLDWIFKLHGLSPVWTITSMNIVTLILLVLVTFIAGYLAGLVFAWFHDVIHKE
jgi:hypothetical protein